MGSSSSCVCISALLLHLIPRQKQQEEQLVSSARLVQIEVQTFHLAFANLFSSTLAEYFHAC